jgi:hypothetical protein
MAEEPSFYPSHFFITVQRLAVSGDVHIETENLTGEDECLFYTYCESKY